MLRHTTNLLLTSCFEIQPGFDLSQQNSCRLFMVALFSQLDARRKSELSISEVSIEVCWAGARANAIAETEDVL